MSTFDPPDGNGWDGMGDTSPAAYYKRYRLFEEDMSGYIRVCSHCDSLGCRLCPTDIRRCVECNVLKPKAELFIYDYEYEYKCADCDPGLAACGDRFRGR